MPLVSNVIRKVITGKKSAGTYVDGCAQSACTVPLDYGCDDDSSAQRCESPAKLDTTPHVVETAKHNKTSQRKRRASFVRRRSSLERHAAELESHLAPQCDPSGMLTEKLNEFTADLDRGPVVNPTVSILSGRSDEDEESPANHNDGDCDDSIQRASVTESETSLTPEEAYIASDLVPVIAKTSGGVPSPGRREAIAEARDQLTPMSDTLQVSRYVSSYPIHLPSPVQRCKMDPVELNEILARRYRQVQIKHHVKQNLRNKMYSTKLQDHLDKGMPVTIDERSSNSRINYMGKTLNLHVEMVRPPPARVREARKMDLWLENSTARRSHLQACGSLR
ncbi:hypothetical protein SAICODRAFT_118265 [Saitoella complicata NRRL Y-17804]|uniref:Uncharacterized protein n=1 Tax=Saitoella complicata (strain BCRC 22490 / CBS 7301 / JCM 7358 / NBRC 10748 / NRRL Y-17804) TaxID=698492 RepID=A0A0E9N8V6_SAICN|nr:uncharacterized protein SAICODRAFT_118265 [Saitoella complicata NRRL Y-17804]ODQ53202.1 hypothetical protein SAICODRAFT_118265 [Saitoella complicata NRRL Y-17804]GAO46327.1 hypothetical protein G7K_0559-t1 [Saitoella complicata NRRL Y-17804]